MGEYTISSRSFGVTKQCSECETTYDAGYRFMYLSCGCGCDSSFEICSICSPMYMKCDCGCNGVYQECTQRPEYGNLMVRINYWCLISITMKKIWKNDVFFFRMWRIKMEVKEWILNIKKKYEQHYEQQNMNI